MSNVDIGGVANGAQFAVAGGCKHEGFYDRKLGDF